MKEPIVKNAADEDQVKDAKVKTKINRETELNDIRALLSTKEGRRVFWRILGHCRVNGTCFDPSGSKAYYNMGKQDVGHFLMADICEADQSLYLKMQLGE